MNINEIKNVNHIGHIIGPSRIKRENKYKIPKYEKKNKDKIIRKYMNILKYRLLKT